MGRSLILPDYLQSPAWLEFIDVIDTVFQASVDKPTRDLAALRNNFRLTDAAEAKVQNASLIRSSEVDWFDRETNLKMLRMSGLLLENASVFTDAQLQRLTQVLPVYWYSKGSFKIQGFLSYVLNTDVEVHTLWTEDYANFYSYKAPEVGTPVFSSGGTWYPTSHVSIAYPSDLTPDEVTALTSLFLAVSPYVVVLNSVYVDTSLRTRPTDTTAAWVYGAPNASVVYTGVAPEIQACLSISQVAPPFTTIRVYVDNVLIDTILTDGTGEWSLTYCSLSSGTHDVYYLATEVDADTSVASPTITSPAIPAPTSQYFTTVIYPYTYIDDFSMSIGALTGQLWGLPLDDATIALPVIVSGTLTVASATPTYTVPIEDFHVNLPTIQSGALDVTINYVNYNNGLVEDFHVNLPTIQSGALDVTINYVNYNNGLVEDFHVNLPTIQSGTLV
jgi:hypothetical protein